MPITIGSNIASLQAQRRLSNASDDVQQISARLSSGLRITKPSDDAAGLAIATSLNTDSRVFSVGMRNVNDGISALSVTQGALTQLSSIATRQIELSEQAANGTYSLNQRKALDQEANALVAEFNRITETTSFNGVKLLQSSSLGQTTIQAGYSTLSFSSGNDLARSVGDGTFGSATTAANVTWQVNSLTTVDLNGDGKLDLIIGGDNAALISLGNGDGTFGAQHSYNLNTGDYNGGQLAYLDVNGDGVKDLVGYGVNTQTYGVLLGNGDGSFRSGSTGVISGTATYRSLTTGDLNNDGIADLVFSNSLSSQASVLFGNGNGTFKAPTTLDFGTSGSNAAVTSIGDLNGDGLTDLVVGRDGLSEYQILFGTGGGSFSSPQTLSAGFATADSRIVDVNHDGIPDIVGTDGSLEVFLGNGNGTFKSRQSFGSWSGGGLQMVDLNGDGNLDVVSSNSYAISNGDGTFKNSNSFAGPISGAISVATGDFNGDGSVDVLIGNNYSASTSVQLAVGHAVKVTSMQQLNLLTQENARQSLEISRSVLDRIGREIGNNGSAQSRLAITVNQLSSSRENFDAAKSRILDADLAEESANYVGKQIIQKVAASILSQANQIPALAFQLLRN